VALGWEWVSSLPILPHDAIDMPAYLESTNPGNLQRYASVGFEVFGTFDLPDDGPTVTTMWREPSAR
jgi:hypothetical protein